MSTTPLWVPLVVAFVAVLGTLAGVIFTQVWNSRLEERRWARETERLREAQAREDLNRTYEHRRGAYVDFLQEFERLIRIYVTLRREAVEIPFGNDPVFDDLVDRWTSVRIYGTHEADTLAYACVDSIMTAARNPQDDILAGETLELRAEYVSQIRKDLGVPERTPADKAT